MAAGDTQTAEFEYQVDDGNGGTDTTIVTITVLGLNDPPSATDNINDVVENLIVVGNVLTDDEGFWYRLRY
jgi:VCBS repeat